MGKKASTALTELENRINQSVKVIIAKEHFGIPEHAIKVILWPTTKYTIRIDRGPTAIIRLGILPNDPDFIPALKRGIAQVIRDHCYDVFAIESTCMIQKRSKWYKEKIGFDENQIPRLLKDHEVFTKVYTRVEVTNRATKQREVVEFKQGSSNVHTAREMAISRLSIKKEDKEEEVRVIPIRAG